MAKKDLQRIRQAVLSGSLKLTHHALEEMDEEDLEIIDIQTVLINGQIIQKQKHQRIVKYRVCGHSITDDRVSVVGRFTAANDFLVITVFRGE